MTEAQTFKSNMQKMQFEGLQEIIAEHNEVVGKVNAATGDKDALFESIASQEEFADLRNQIADLEAELEKQVNVKVQEALTSDQGDLEELTAKAKEMKSTVAAGISYYKKLYGDDAAEAFTKVERLKGTRVGGGGTGGRRVRGFRVVVSDSDGTTEYENFASAAKALGIGTKDLQELFFAKAGAEKLADVPDEVTFNLSWEEEDEDGNRSTASAEVRAYRVDPSETSEAVEVEDEDPEVEDLTDSDVPDEDELTQIG